MTLTGLCDKRTLPSNGQTWQDVDLLSDAGDEGLAASFRPLRPPILKKRAVHDGFEAHLTRKERAGFGLNSSSCHGRLGPALRSQHA